MTLSPFVRRHIGPSAQEQQTMLSALNCADLDTLIDQAVPSGLRPPRPLIKLPHGVDEHEALAELETILGCNQVLTSLIGQGYYGCITPPVIQRNMLENPGWYTSYTPYQPEISQGRLEMLFNFQTLVTELTGLPIAGASLLDEATAVAEAATLAVRSFKGKRQKILVASELFPQTLSILKTRLTPLNLPLVMGAEADMDEQTAGVIIQWPDAKGLTGDFSSLIERAKAVGAQVILAADPLALTRLKSPAQMGVDIAVGSMQRYGVPMGLGGPHAAYMAVTDKLKRLMPGRLIGQSVDADGKPAYRLALQTREQHIRRDAATSNICTAQALLANMAAAFAIYHGPEGLEAIANRAHGYATAFADAARGAGYDLAGDAFFDTVTLITPEAQSLQAKARAAGLALHATDNTLSLAFDETTNAETMDALAEVFGFAIGDGLAGFDNSEPSALDGIVADTVPLPNPAPFRPFAARDGAWLSQEIFHAVRSETQMMRYLRKLMDKDLALDRAMIPLGSCTMKLNAAAEMMPVTWTQNGGLHPFLPADCYEGTRVMARQTEDWLSEITGFAATSLQPNAGSQGEYAGLLAIRAYHAANGQSHRDVCLIPTSAHGTNPASAVMCGLKIVPVQCDEAGNVDLTHFAERIAEYGDRLAALMITYPSTHGVFEDSIKDICAQVHDAGGQVYMDGANLNAMVGLVRPGDIGADVCHMNLHKTFCIPHGGGGPGIGPIGVAEHLAPFLPGNGFAGEDRAVSAAPLGSASIICITWMYIRMMGREGLTQATKVAILNANYLAERIKGSFPVLYRGGKGRVAHECILDTRDVKDLGVTVDDLAKRLIDYGFHAPTMSWPVAGTLMVEPTESEDLAELDRFADAMNAIRAEIAEIESGKVAYGRSALAHAPHSTATLAADDWDRDYSRTQGAFPAGQDAGDKYWPPVSRVDNAFGDRNLVCSCPPMESFTGEV